ncbi:MAG: tetratricopeptide repeat protein [Kiritimatiellia bacterium]
MKKATCCLGWLAVCAALGAAPSMAANILHLTNGREIVFKNIRWDAAKGEFLLNPISGGDAVIPVAKKDVRRLELDPPPEMVQAQQMLAANRLADAIPLLQTVIAKFRGLELDNTARELLARIYVKGNEPAKAIRMVDELLAEGKGTYISGPLRIEYWKALLAIEPKNVRIVKDFDEAIATGPREAVPVAFVLRGNVRRAAGQKEDALQDYLRTVLFFENAGSWYTEAVTKASELLDEMGESARAVELRQKLTIKK